MSKCPQVEIIELKDRVAELESAARDFMQLADKQILVLAVSAAEYERYAAQQQAHALALVLPPLEPPP